MAISLFEQDLQDVLSAFDAGERSLNDLYDMIHHRISKSRLVYEIVLTYGDLADELVQEDGD